MTWCHFPVILSLLMKVFLLNQLFNCHSSFFFFNFLHHSLDVVHILLILPEQEDKLKRTFKSHVSWIRICVYYLKETVDKKVPNIFSSAFPCLWSECGLKHSCRQNCIFCCSSQCLSVWGFLYDQDFTSLTDFCGTWRHLKLSGSKEDMNLVCLFSSGRWQSHLLILWSSVHQLQSLWKDERRMQVPSVDLPIAVWQCAGSVCATPPGQCLQHYRHCSCWAEGSCEGSCCWGIVAESVRKTHWSSKGRNCRVRETCVWRHVLAVLSVRVQGHGCTCMWI